MKFVDSSHPNWSSQHNSRHQPTNRSAGHCSADHRMWDKTWVPFPTIPPPCPFHSKQILFHLFPCQKQPKTSDSHPQPIPNRSPSAQPQPGHTWPASFREAGPHALGLALQLLRFDLQQQRTRRWVARVHFEEFVQSLENLGCGTGDDKGFLPWSGPCHEKIRGWNWQTYHFLGICTFEDHVERSHTIHKWWATFALQLSDWNGKQKNFQIDVPFRSLRSANENTTYWETEHRFPMVWVKFAEPKGWQQVRGSHFDCLNSETLSLVGGFNHLEKY